VLPAALSLELRKAHPQSVVLVIGAGCSIESPTGLKTAAHYSREAYEELRAVEAIPEMSDPGDLSALADLVEAETGSKDLLIRRLPLAEFRNAHPNHGYLIAAALQAEKIIRSTLSLNYDLAGVGALRDLRVDTVEQVFAQDDLSHLGPQLFAFLHGSARTAGVDWVLTAADLNEEWRSRWQQVIADQALVSPVVVLAGLGSSAPVVAESIKKIRSALGVSANYYLADLGSFGSNRFAAELELDESAYIQVAWCAFMEELGSVALRGMIDRAKAAVPTVKADNAGIDESIALESVGTNIQDIGLLGFGRIRSRWTGSSVPYQPSPETPAEQRMETDLLLALAQMDASHGPAVLSVDGRVTLGSGEGLRRVGLFSGGGSMDFEVARLRIQEHGLKGCDIHVVAHTNAPNLNLPPLDLVEPDESDDLLRGPATPLFYLPHLRNGSVAWDELVA